VGHTKKTIKILVADRNLLFRSGLRVLLSSEADMTVVAEAGELTEALGETAACGPDVLVLDSSLAADAPIPVLRDLKCAVLLLAPEETEEQLQLAVRAGARAYMLKTSSPAELVAGIRQVASAGQEELGGLSKIVPDLQALQASTEQGQRPTALTSRERDVLRILAEGRTAREAATELGVSIKTVEAHKLNLMRKLDVHDRASLIACAAVLESNTIQH
jgi:two-component system response regulator NreC